MYHGDERAMPRHRGVDPRLAQHVAEITDTLENHGLLLARLLDNE
jgi:hypothetical protein